VVEAAMITKSWRTAAGLGNFTMLQKSYRKLLYRRDREQMSENAYSCSITDTFGCHLWKAIAPESSNRGSPKLGLKV